MGPVTSPLDPEGGTSRSWFLGQLAAVYKNGHRLPEARWQAVGQAVRHLNHDSGKPTSQDSVQHASPETQNSTVGIGLSFG